MISTLRITAVAMLGAALVSGGCATKGFVRRGLAGERSAMDSAMTAERSQRMASDQDLTTQLGQVRGDVTQLRSDLASLRTDFGAKITMLEQGLQFDMPVHFDFNQSALRADAQPMLDRFSDVVQKYYPGSVITVEGFADPAGSSAYNKRLSEKRANAVSQYLTTKGLSEGQLRTVGYGEARQVVPGASKNSFGADLNRRVTFVIETPANAQLVAPAGVSANDPSQGAAQAQTGTEGQTAPAAVSSR